MNYTVDWIPEAEDDLADAWLNAHDPNAVTDAQARIDRLLARDPVNSGKQVHEGLYQIVDAPLTVFYSVDPARRLVEVSRVWYTP
jgi:plasmid stabilization system protein ParE